MNEKGFSCFPLLLEDKDGYAMLNKSDVLGEKSTFPILGIKRNISFYELYIYVDFT